MLKPNQHIAVPCLVVCGGSLDRGVSVECDGQVTSELEVRKEANGVQRVVADGRMWPPIPEYTEALHALHEEHLNRPRGTCHISLTYRKVVAEVADAQKKVQRKECARESRMFRQQFDANQEGHAEVEEQ